MWIYYNSLRQQSTAVPHGSVVRQGDNLDIILACPLYWAAKNAVSGVTLWYKTPSSDEAQVGTYATLTQKKFRKMQDAEITFGLVDGKAYDTFEFHLPYSSYPATKDYGNLIIQFSKGAATAGASLKGNYFSQSKIYVEKSVFSGKADTISTTQYAKLISTINQLAHAKIAYFAAEDCISTESSSGSNNVLKITSMMGSGAISGRFKLLQEIPENGSLLIATNHDTGLRLIENVGTSVTTDSSNGTYYHHYVSSPVFVHGKTDDGGDRELYLIEKRETSGATETPSDADGLYYGSDGKSEACTLELHCLEADKDDEIAMSGSVPLSYEYDEDLAEEAANPLGLYWADEEGETD